MNLCEEIGRHLADLQAEQILTAQRDQHREPLVKPMTIETGM